MNDNEHLDNEMPFLTNRPAKGEVDDENIADNVETLSSSSSSNRSNMNTNKGLEDTVQQRETLSVGLSLALAIGFILFWPLFAALRVIISENGALGIGNGQIIEFDTDAYMALKSIIDSSTSDDMSSTYRSEILELPQLSPAEKIVGAFFGPPSSK